MLQTFLDPGIYAFVDVFHTLKKDPKLGPFFRAFNFEVISNPTVAKRYCTSLA
jgi:hypothetical protein